MAYERRDGGRGFGEGAIAEFDQEKAKAMDLLRRTDGPFFVVAGEPNEGGVSRMLACIYRRNTTAADLRQKTRTFMGEVEEAVEAAKKEMRVT